MITTTPKSHRNLVEGYLNDIEAGDAVAAIWTTYDILSMAKKMNVSLTHVEARDVLSNILTHYNATLGVNWDVIQTHIDMYDLNRIDQKERN
jgi:hypothetical protein